AARAPADAATARTQAVRERGGRGTVNPGEAPLNAVSGGKPEVLTGLGQQGGGEAAVPRTHRAPRAHPRRRGATEPARAHRRNGVSPWPSLAVRTAPAARRRQRVRDGGGSAGRPVLGRRGVAPRRQHPTRKGAD